MIQAISRLQCLRTEDVPAGPIMLFGDTQELALLTIDGVAPAEGLLRQIDSRLEINISADEVTFTIITRHPTARRYAKVSGYVAARTATAALYLARLTGVTSD